jgi:hypothetical protein
MVEGFQPDFLLLMMVVLLVLGFAAQEAGPCY